MSSLIVIPARAGSKGLPGKNTKQLGGKPLILYSIDFAKLIKEEGDVICISTNDEEVCRIAESVNIDIHFKRPEILATDTATTYDVLIHALHFFHERGIDFDKIILLQPTSPLRKLADYYALKTEYDKGCDMAVTVKLSKDNPYFNLFEERPDGTIKMCIPSDYSRRQDTPLVYSYNGSIYLINVASLKKNTLQQFSNIRKSVMPTERSVDIDTEADWLLTELYLKQFTDENN